MPFIAPLVAVVSSAIGAVGTFIAGLGILGQVLIVGGLNIAVGYLQKKMNKKRNNQVGGAKIEKEYGQEVARSVAMGLVGASGHDLYVNTFGSSNKFFQQVYVLSDYITSGLRRVNINGENVAFGEYDAEKGLPVISGDYAGLIWIKYYDGKQTAADNYLIGNANPIERWTVDHKGIGTSYVIVSMTYDQEKLSSEPQFFFEYYGAPLYDWRKDSTRGGSGPHRLNDVSTHEFTENPIVMEYNYRVGLSINGDLFCGMNMPLSDLPLDKWTVAANLCDETVSLEPRYRCSMFVDCMDTHGNNIETMTNSCGAMTVEGVTGVWPLVGSSQPVVITFTDDDLIDGQPVRYRARRSMSDLVNSVSGNFIDISQVWASIGYDPQISTTAISIDRRTRDVNIDFPQVYSARQAGQLASIYLKENRYEATATITLRPRFCVLEVGDWVRWNSERYGNKVYIVTGTAIAPLDDEDGPRNINVSLQERDGSIYDGVTPAVPVVPYPPGTPQYMSEIDFVLTPVTVEGDTGVRQAAIRATWDIIPDVTIVGVEFRWYPVLQPTLIFTKIAGQNRSTITLFTDGVVGETQYAVQSRPITDPERPVVWGPVHLVTTEAASDDIYGPIIDAIKDNLEWISNTSRSAVEAAAELIDYVTELTTANYTHSEEIRREIVSTTGEANARFTEQIQVLTNDTQAYGIAITNLTAEFEDSVAYFNSQIETLASADATLAGRTDNLFAALGGNNAQINIRWAVAAAIGGYAARWALQAAVNADGLFRQASMFLDVPAATSSPTRIGFIADQIIMTNYSNDVVVPFFLSGGILYLNQVNIQFANIGNLQVGTSNLAPNAVTDVQFAQDGGGSGPREVYLTCNHGLGSPKIEIKFKGVVRNVASETAYTSVILTDMNNGQELERVNAPAAPAAAGQGYLVNWWKDFVPPSDRSSTTFRIVYQGYANSEWTRVAAITTVYKR